MKGTILLSAHSMLRVLGVNDLADVTLACIDGQQVKARKVILAAKSTFFFRIREKMGESDEFRA